VLGGGGGSHKKVTIQAFNLDGVDLNFIKIKFTTVVLGGVSESQNLDFSELV
jgi:hypothetical protein